MHLPKEVQSIANLYTIVHLGDALAPALRGMRLNRDGTPMWRVEVFHQTTRQSLGALYISEESKKIEWKPHV
jgi:hypothetical protein